MAGVFMKLSNSEDSINSEDSFKPCKDLSASDLSLFPKYFKSLGLKIADYLNVRPGEHVLVSGGVHQFDLLKQICSKIAVKGAYYDLDIGLGDTLSVETASRIPMKTVSRPADSHDRYKACLYDAAICINSVLDEQVYSKIPQNRQKAGISRALEINDLAKARKRRSIFMAWPTKQKADHCNMTLQEFEKLFIECLNIDIQELSDLGTRIKTFLSQGGRINIKSDAGTDLCFYLDPLRRIMIDSGMFDSEMVSQGDITKNLPCGEVYTTALEDTVEGTAVFDLSFVEGRPIKNLKLFFKKGRLIDYTAEQGIELFEKKYSNATGDKDKIGELGIGINPAMIRPIGHTLLDEKIYGSIHLALGENRMYGGVNSSSMHWDLVMLKPDLLINGKNLLNKGRFSV
jgi:leucyl aminopeptidase (aminopeptidase T)